MRWGQVLQSCIRFYRMRDCKTSYIKIPSETVSVDEVKQAGPHDIGKTLGIKACGSERCGGPFRSSKPNGNLGGTPDTGSQEPAYEEGENDERSH